MSIDFKKLLPSNLRDSRWGQFVEAIQSVLQTIREEKIDIIDLQYEIESMTEDQIIAMRDTLGFNFLSFEDNYTNSLEYLKRQILTVLPRINHRNTRTAYKYNFYIYELIADLYPTYLDSNDKYLVPITNWWTFDELNEEYVSTFDQDSGTFSGLAFDDSVILTFDQQPILDRLTRHILFPYTFRYVDNNSNNEWMSEETLNSFYNDILLTKKATEISIFEPYVNINCSGNVGDIYSGTPVVLPTTKQVFNSYDGDYSGIVESFYFGSSFSSGVANISFVQFGTGGYTNLYSAYTAQSVQTPIVLSGVANGLFNIANDFSVTTASGVCFIARKNITQKYKFTDYSEIAFKDAASGLVLYSKFPTVKVGTQEKFYSNIQVRANLV